MQKIYRGKGQKKDPETCWDKSLDPKQQVIACFREDPPRAPIWGNVKHELERKLSKAEYWPYSTVDNPREIYFRLDNNLTSIKNASFTAEPKRPGNGGVAMVYPTAYPSPGLTQAVHHSLEQARRFSFYYLLMNDIPDDLYPCIYVISEHEVDPLFDSAIYAGQTTVKDRMLSHLRDKKEFIQYMSYWWNASANWAVTIFPYKACQTFAVAGQLTPNLVANQEFQQWLNDKFSEDRLWGLKQAEIALFAYCNPHFNVNCNPYSKPLYRKWEK